MPAPIIPAPSTTTLRAAVLVVALGPRRALVDGLQVEEERARHVRRDLPAGELGEVARLDRPGVVDVDLGPLDGRAHDVVRRGHRGVLELLAQVGREGRQVLRELRHRRRTTGDSCNPSGPRAGRPRGWPGSSPWPARSARRACPRPRGRVRPRGRRAGCAAGPAAARSSGRRPGPAGARPARRRRHRAAGRGSPRAGRSSSPGRRGRCGGGSRARSPARRRARPR